MKLVLKILLGRALLDFFEQGVFSKISRFVILTPTLAARLNGANGSPLYSITLECSAINIWWLAMNACCTLEITTFRWMHQVFSTKDLSAVDLADLCTPSRPIPGSLGRCARHKTPRSSFSRKSQVQSLITYHRRLKSSRYHTGGIWMSAKSSLLTTREPHQFRLQFRAQDIPIRDTRTYITSRRAYETKIGRGLSIRQTRSGFWLPEFTKF